jgi:hypothetical protein
MTRFSFALLTVSIACAAAAEKPGAQIPDGVVSAEYVSNIGLFSGAAPPKETPGQAWLCVTLRRSIPPSGEKTVPVNLIRVTGGADASYPLIGIAPRWKSKGAPVYRLLKGEPLPDDLPKGSAPRGEAHSPSGGWSDLFKVEGDRLVSSGAGFFEDSNPKKLLLSVESGKAPGEDYIAFSKSPLTLQLLFLIPKSAQGLQLRFGGDEPFPLTLK